jgi:HAD superfamily phosphatase (TIGR01668 family)
MSFWAHWIQPDYRFPSVYEIDYGLLYERGVRTLFFDLDQTLVASHEFWEPSLKLKMLLQKLQDQQFKCFILTNRRTGVLLEKLSQRLNIPIICSCLKPLPWLLKNFIETNLDGNFKSVVVVGDHLFSDVLLAKGLGCRSVWVHSLKPVKDLYQLFLKPFEEMYETNAIPQGTQFVKHLLLILITSVMLGISTVAQAFEMGSTGQITEIRSGEGAQISLSLFQDQNKSQTITLQIERNIDEPSSVSKNNAIDWNKLIGQVQLNREKLVLEAGEVAQCKVILNPGNSLSPGYYGVWIRAAESWPRKFAGQEIQTATHQSQRLPLIVRVLP